MLGFLYAGRRLYQATTTQSYCTGLGTKSLSRRSIWERSSDSEGEFSLMIEVQTPKMLVLMLRKQ